MKGIELDFGKLLPKRSAERSDHCPAMKGIELIDGGGVHGGRPEKRPLPRNEGD